MPAFLTRPVRFLPRGPLDALAQLALVFVAYYAYRFTQGAIDDPISVSTALANSHWIIDVERALHIDVERGGQRVAAGIPGLDALDTFFYVNAQLTITFGAMAYIYAAHPRAFGFVRNMFVVAWALALVGYVLLPTAPPRLVPGLGVHDVVARVTGVDPSAPNVSRLFNPYAAVPSMHVGFSLMVGIPLARLSVHRPVRIFWMVYPLIVTFVVLATGNHFLLDGVFGAAVVAVAALAAQRLGRLRPDAWRFALPGPEAEAELEATR